MHAHSQTHTHTHTVHSGLSFSFSLAVETHCIFVLIISKHTFSKVINCVLTEKMRKKKELQNTHTHQKKKREEDHGNPWALLELLLVLGRGLA